MFTNNLINQTTTENGAQAFKSTNSAILDLFSTGISSSNKQDLVVNAINENPVLAIKCCLYLRDVRQGQGNRDILRALFKLLLDLDQVKVLKKLLPHIPEIGRWKDIIELIGINPKVDKKIFKLIRKGLESQDALLAKWLPRQGVIAKTLATYLELNHGTYRRWIVKLSKTVEQDMCKQNWSEINYSAVPSIANKKYANAFLAKDSERRTQFLEKAVKGEVKMHSSVLYPHQISKMCMSGSGWDTQIENNPTADALWANLPNYMEQAVNVLPIIDLSSSMFSKATGTEGSCMDIAIGLGLYFAEHNTGSYKDIWMNFSNKPQAYKLKGDTLSERIQNLDFNNWGGSTNIDAAMDFVLQAAKTSPEDAPKMIIIISDMEFNQCIKSQTNFQYAKEEFQAAGIEMPTIVFWRVDTKTGTQPVTMNDKGAVLINGYSPSVMKELLAGDIANYNPYTAMLKILEPKYTFLDKLGE